VTDEAQPEFEPALEETIRRLRAERPVPHPAFRGDLRRQLLSTPTGSRPGRVRAAIVAYATSGLGLLAVAAVGLAGVGPFAA
jgi:hypothetical protein